MATIDNFLARIVKDADGCWIWHGAISPKGYGMFNIPAPEKTTGRKFKRVLAHRYSYEHFKEALNKGEEISPTVCNKRNCMNPDHWTKSTQGKRTLLSWKSGVRKEDPAQIGELNRNVKLTEEQVEEILKAPQSISNVTLGEIYGVSNAHISRIRLKHRWEHLTNPGTEKVSRKVVVFCKTCANPFKVNPSRYNVADVDKPKYCSKDCYTIAQENDYGTDGGKARMAALKGEGKKKNEKDGRFVA